MRFTRIASAPPHPKSIPTSHKPNWVMHEKTTPGQALVYCLSGDYNRYALSSPPLFFAHATHSDPCIGVSAGLAQEAPAHPPPPTSEHVLQPSRYLAHKALLTSSSRVSLVFAFILQLAHSQCSLCEQHLLWAQTNISICSSPVPLAAPSVGTIPQPAPRAPTSECHMPSTSACPPLLHDPILCPQSGNAGWVTTGAPPFPLITTLTHVSATSLPACPPPHAPLLCVPPLLCAQPGNAGGSRQVCSPFPSSPLSLM
jgi:hypothetical protein